MMSRVESVLLMLATVLAGGSGLVLHVMKEWMTPFDPFAVVHHPWQPFVMKLHVLSVPFLVLVLGMTVTAHAIDRLTKGRRRGRRTGLAVLGTILPMILSGVLIQVLTAPAVLRATIWTHLASSLFFLAAYVAHQIMPPSTRNATDALPSGYPQGVRSAPRHRGGEGLDRDAVRR